MQEGNTEKAGRLLGIYTRLMNGDVVNVQVEAVRYKVDVRSIQRDIATIKNYLVSANENDAYTNNIVYDRKKKGHRLEKIYQKMLNNSEILAICKILREHFSIPYKDRFEEGEFRKRIQFMYGGKLQKIRFEYRGGSLEAVLDRIPTAVIESENKEQGTYIISAEVFGMGINRWIRSQGDDVRILDGRTGT